VENSEQAMTFDNGMTDAEEDAVYELSIDLGHIRTRIEALARHRNYSLAVTKIEEAQHWLLNRMHKPA
jgi:hypothetical protein